MNNRDDDHFYSPHFLYSLEYDKNECTGSIASTETVSNLTSPLYPANYPQGLNCSWLISAPLGKSISFYLREYNTPGHTIPTFRFGYTEDCGTSLTIYDGPNTDSPVLMRKCEGSLHYSLPEQTSTGHEILILFVTSERRPIRYHEMAKFRLEHRAINRTCEFVVQVENETYIESPYYNENDGDLLNCSWLLIAPENSRMKLNITEIILMKTPSCSESNLHIYEVVANGNYLIGEYCGRSPARNIQVRSEKALVRLLIRKKFGGQRFALNVTLESNEPISIPEKKVYVTNAIQNISSLRYPLLYINNVEETWNLVAPKNRRIRIAIENVHLEYSEDCIYDFLKIYDGNNTNAPLLGKFCDHLKKKILITTGSTAFIQFVSDETVSNTGFLLEIALYYEGNCNDVIDVKDSGNITSPYYPHFYPDSIKCSWVLNAPKDKIIYMVAEVEIEYSDNCTSDYLILRCDSNDEKRVCGEHTNVIYICHHQAFISFISDEFIHGKGINVQYSVGD